MTKRVFLSAMLAFALTLTGLFAPMVSAHRTEYRCYNSYYQQRTAEIYPVSVKGEHYHEWGPWYTISYGC